MKLNIEKRLDDLETRNGNGGYIVIDARELSDEQAQEAIAEAEKRVGKRGKVITIEYAESWPPN
jgi:hypothetical protein